METLGFSKPPKRTTIAVAMSGGVDSSVTAALLKEEGYDVFGVTLHLSTSSSQACCGGRDIYDARNVAGHLDIPHYVMDYAQKFQEEVIEDFVDSYSRGETPVPCVRCNQTVKFRDLLDVASRLGAEALATGHYVRWRQGPDKAELCQALDMSKDQSYFLFATTQHQLERLRFPLGGVRKEDTRALARRFELAVAEKPESQDLCFVQKGHYTDFLSQKLASLPGDIVHVDGTHLGRHKGIIHYTIGQRRGLNLGSTAPLYVVRLDSHAQTVVVGPRSALETHTLALRDVNWLGSDLELDSPVTVKIRSSMVPVPAYVTREEEGRAQVTLKTPLYGIAPGQACVFYHGERVLGGGWIS